MRFVLTTPIDIPANSTAFIYAYDPSSNTVLDYATFSSSSTIGTGTEIDLSVSVRVARCMYKILSCTDVVLIDCGQYAIPYNLIKETITISTGAHTFNAYKVFALVGTNTGSIGSIGSTVTCRLYCGSQLLYDIGSFTLTDNYAPTYYACLNLLSVQSII